MENPDKLELKIINIINPDNLNFVFGQSHFIKSVEDIHELLVNTVPGTLFGLAFAEASGPRKVRTSGTDEPLIKLAAENAMQVACGHTFFIFMKNFFPINILPGLKNIPEVVNIFCASANPVQVIVARTGQGNAVLGVVDGGAPTGVENAEDVKIRHKLLQDFGYKM